MAPQPLPAASADWDPETKALAQQLQDLGQLWANNRAEYDELNERRKELFIALRGKVRNTDIAALFGCEKGAVEQTFARLRRLD